MPTLKEIERIFVCQQNSTVLPPFPTTLPVGGTVPLCSITVPIGRRPEAFLVRAVVNWSATFTPIISLLTLTGLGFAQVTFEILRDGVPIARVTQTINQPDGTIGVIFGTAVTGFNVATLEVLDTTSLIDGTGSPISTFELQATNIIAVAPANVLGTVVVPLATVTLAAGAVTLVVEEIETCRAQAL